MVFQVSRWVAVVAVAAWMLAPGMATAQQRIAADEFLASAGARAFQAGDFAGAAAGFEALLTQYPDDPLILRYLGIAHDRAGNYAAARDAYMGALAIEPDGVATRYFLGVTEYKLGDNEAAAREFQTVIAQAPESDYGRSAKDFLTAIDANPTPVSSRFSGFAQVGFQEDGNVTAGPRGAEVRGSAFNQYVSLAYEPLKTEATTVSVSVGGFFSQHPDPIANDYDMAQGSVGLELGHVTAAGGVPLMPSLSYRFSRTLLAGKSYGANHALTASLGMGLGDSAMATFSYGATWQIVDDKGTLPAYTSQDGVNQSAGLDTRLFFADRRAALTLGYNYGWTEADGRNAVARSHSGTAGLWARLPWQVDAQATAGLTRTDYPDFAGPVPRDARTQTYGLSLSRGIAGQLSASLGGTVTLEESSDYSALSYDRAVISLSLGYRF